MADITPRSLRFEFELPDLDRSEEELGEILPALGLSLTMPYLEPYLIRTMKTALPEIRDPQLAQDVRRFSQQEGHHYRNHAAFNERVRECFAAPVADEIRSIEAALEADYQRFTRAKSLRFNVGYAEGFEAMTCASALALAENGRFDDPGRMPGGEIWAWHMAEEIEHRTVAFDVFEHLVGSYAYRIAIGTWAQVHYVRYIARFARTMAHALGCRLGGGNGELRRRAARNYLRTWSPRYDPARIEVPDGVEALLERFSALAHAG